MHANELLDVEGSPGLLVWGLLTPVGWRHRQQSEKQGYLRLAAAVVAYSLSYCWSNASRTSGGVW
jgi:hypothetical protein